MTERKVNKQIPVIFQNVEKYEKEDSRFLKVKIWLMHTGKNLNGSSFDKEVVDTAIPTLANTPILAFIEENSAGEQDFSDHRMVLHRTSEGGIEFKYLGSAVGVIPENNNAHWEKRVTDAGEEKEYLVVDGLMWTKWGDPTDIMANKLVTSQSMELHDDYTGSWDKDGVFHFESFSFFGACLLGNDVSPAMENSTVEVQFSKDTNLQKTIEDKLNEFYTLFSQQGGTGMEETKETVLDEQVESQEHFEQKDEEEKQEQETPTDFSGQKEEDEQLDETKTEFEQKEEVKTEVEEEAPAQEFALTANQVEDQIRSALKQHTHIDRWGDTCRLYWYVDRTDTHVIVENTQDSYQLYALPYTVNGDNVEVQTEGAYKVKIEYLPFEGESVAFTSNIERFESEKAETQSQLDELKSYKRNQKELEVKAKFADKLSEEEFTQVFESLKDADISDVEDKLFALYGKKNFSIQKPKTDTNKVQIVSPKKEDAVQSPYGDIFDEE